MEQYPKAEMWPDVPHELKYSELRLPGAFRELLANRNFTNEEIGRIVRCLALDTDLFLDQKIEPEVFYYRQKLISNEKLRRRVRMYRERRRMANAAGRLASEVSKSGTVTVTVTDGKHVEPSSTPEKTPILEKKTEPPIVPLEKKSVPSLEKNPVYRRKTGRKDVTAGELQGDLFASAGVELTETGAARLQIASEVLDDGTSVQDIERGPRAVPVPPTAFDTRVDLSWIPARFSRFWEQYPRKVAKQDALKAFTKIIKTQEDVEKFMSVLMASLSWWKIQPSWTKDGGKFVPHPATWLNRGSWEDSKDNKYEGGAQFLSSDEESDDELIKRMENGG